MSDSLRVSPSTNPPPPRLSDFHAREYRALDTLPHNSFSRLRYKVIYIIYFDTSRLRQSQRRHHYT